MAATNNKGAIFRFAIIYFIIVIGFGLVIRKIVQIQHVEKPRWIALSDSLRRINKIQELEPNRGNIYSSNGELMASTVPSYYLYMDFQTPALRENGGKLFYDNLDSLSLCLSKKFHDKSESAYRKHLIRGYNQKKRHYALNKVKLSHSMLKDVKQFPLFRLGYKSGLISEKQIKRIKPYGSLAAITIGALYGEKSKGAKYGLEYAYDSILRGSSGWAHLEKKAGANVLITDQAPKNGADITTTLNVDMQDIAEKALKQKLIEIDADLGCVVLMEVKTGQIKACVNLKKVADGDYREAQSIVLPSNFEPGSTQKIPALMAALEDGLIKPTDTIDCKDGTWRFNEKVTITDHNTGLRANGKIPVSQVIVRSSNVGMAKIIYNAYKDNPQQFVSTLKKMGVGMPMDLGFEGAAVASIKGPDDNPLWASSDLASMAYGYSVNMPLMYTLTFYNAIANNGKMMQPYFVKKISRDGELINEFTPKILKNAICSDKTLATIKNMMLQVIEDTVHGTGTPVKSKYVRIAGKTGTARYNYQKGEVMRHQASFCGFYPYENPEFSCIVFIRNPRIGNASGGGMAGTVFKEIAERVMASHSLLPIGKYPIDTARTVYPKIKNGNFEDAQKVLSALLFPVKNEPKLHSWVNFNTDSSSISYSSINMAKKIVPNVKGMGIKDALYLLESEGVKVRVKGRGKVVHQSIKAGTPIFGKQIINLQLQ